MSESSYSTYVVCGSHPKSTVHLFKNSDGVHALAFACCWGEKLDLWPSTTIPEFIEAGLSPPSGFCVGRGDQASFTTLAFCNDCIFKGKLSMLEVVTLLNLNIEELSSSFCYIPYFMLASRKEI